MTKVDLLYALKEFTTSVYAGMVLPCKPDSTENERSVQVFLTHLPTTSASAKFAPYVIHSIITGEDGQNEGEDERAYAVVRTIFCTYDKDEEQGGLALLTLAERLRIELLRKRVLANRFQLELPKSPMQLLVYPDNTAPFYVAETSSTWRIPAVEREVNYG